MISLGSSKKKLAWLVILPVWVYVAFWAAQLLVSVIYWALSSAGVPFETVNLVLLTTAISTVAYIAALCIVIGLPFYAYRRRTTKQELGVSDWPAWMDILLSLPAFVIYVIGSGLLVLLLTKLIPGIDTTQPQELPFSRGMLGTQVQYFLAFFTLVILAPLAEELLFRGYLYGKLRRVAPVTVSVIVASLAFGLAHLWPGPGSSLQWAVTIDTFALSLVLCLLREYTGAIWASVIVHAIKNGLAFYLLFINTDLMQQIQSAILPLIIGG